MKRVGYLYGQVCAIDNLILAERKARRGKSSQRDVIRFVENLEDNIINLHHILVNKEYQISEYHIFKIKDPKERTIYKLPYKDRVVQHAIMNILEKIFVRSFTFDSYSCIKKRGIHLAIRKLSRSLKNIDATRYCLKLDIKKFYPSINNNILKKLLERKFKDKDLLGLLYNIIQSADGQPIGNYLSQYLANFYLTYFDH